MTQLEVKTQYNKDIEKTLTQQEEEDNCSICYESKKTKGYVVLGCKHSFCLSCLIKQAHIKQNCPMCRGKFDIDIKKENKKKLESIHGSLFSEILTRSKNVETFKYKDKPINFNEFLRIQFKYYKNNESENVIETTKEGIDRLAEISTVLVTEYYSQQLRE